MPDSSTDSQAIPADRAELVLRASWEISGIATLMHAHLDCNPKNLAFRALLRRCDRLACMVMSAIDEPNIGLQALQSVLDDREVSNV